MSHTPVPKVYPAQLKATLERGNAGDPTVIPALRRAFAEHPELAAELGDLADHAEQSLLTLIAGTSLTAREAIAHQVAELRARLLATASNELETLLVARIAVSWLEVYHGDCDLAERLLNEPGASPITKAAERRLDRAHLRFLSALKTLATVQKLLKPSLSPLAMVRPVAETTGLEVARRRTGVPTEGIPVSN